MAAGHAEAKVNVQVFMWVYIRVALCRGMKFQTNNVYASNADSCSF